MGRQTKQSESLVDERWVEQTVSRVPPDTWNPVGIRGDHPPSLNTTQWPIENKYCEGKVKSTPGGEWKRTWNLVLTSTESPTKGWSGTFCRMVRRVNVSGKVKNLRFGAEARASLNRAHKVRCIWPETGWPTHVQAEVEVKLHGGPNTRPLKWPVMRCG